MADAVIEFESKNDWFRPDAGGSTDPIMTPGQWAYWLDHFADETVPGHLKTSDALKQAGEIANTLILGMGDEMLWPSECMIGIAWAIARALNEGQRIRSLAFIAVKLAYRVAADDLSWARDYPSDLGGSDNWTNDFLEQALRTLRRRGISHCPWRLRAQYRKSELYDLSQKMGVRKLEKAIATKTPAEGRQVIGWGFFKD